MNFEITEDKGSEKRYKLNFSPPWWAFSTNEYELTVLSRSPLKKEELGRIVSLLLDSRQMWKKKGLDAEGRQKFQTVLPQYLNTNFYIVKTK